VAPPSGIFRARQRFQCRRLPPSPVRRMGSSSTRAWSRAGPEQRPQQAPPAKSAAGREPGRPQPASAGAASQQRQVERWRSIAPADENVLTADAPPQHGSAQGCSSRAGAPARASGSIARGSGGETTPATLRPPAPPQRIPSMAAGPCSNFSASPMSCWSAALGSSSTGWCCSRRLGLPGRALSSGSPQSTWFSMNPFPRSYGPAAPEPGA